MLPTTFEFRWDAGHMIFFGAFYSVITVVLTSLVFTAVKSAIDVYKRCKADDEQRQMDKIEVNEGGSELGAET